MQGTELTPKAPLGNNARPLQQVHHRTIRTNIDFNKVNFWQICMLNTKLRLFFTESTAELSINVQRNVLQGE
jgi:hypothetical protein